MSAYQLIDQFAGDGIRLTAENGQVVFEGPREVLTPERIDELRRHKTELLAALTANQLDAFEERAAIMEFDSRPKSEPPVPRAEAERRATADIINLKGYDHD